MDIIVSAVWTFAAILSPFEIFCAYPLFKYVAWLGSPYMVVPSVIGSSALAYLIFGGHSFPDFFLNNHFLIGAVIVLGAYGLFLKRYSPVDSILLSVLVVIGADQLWQLPLDAMNWTAGSLAAAEGLATVSFSLMSIPVLFYLVDRINGNVRVSGLLLLLAAVATVAEVPFLKPGNATVWFSPIVMACWVPFLASAVLASRKPLR